MSRTDLERRRRHRRERELSPDTGTGPRKDLRLARRLVPFFRPHRSTLVLALLSYPVASLFHLAQPYVVKVAIDEHLIPKRLEGFGTLVSIFMLFVALEFAARFWQTILTQLLGQRVTKDLRLALFSQLQKVDVGFLERNPIGRLMTRVTNDVESISEAFSAGAVSILGDIVTLTGIVIMMLSLDVRMALYAFTVLPVLIGIVAVFRKYARAAFRAVRTQLARMNGFLNEAISGMSIVQVFRQEQEMRREFEEINASYRDANVQAILYDAMTYAIVEAIGTLATALILFLGMHELSSGRAEIGVFVAFFDYLRRFFAPITELSTKYTIIQSAMTSAERCVDLLDEVPKVVDPASPVALPRLEHALRFENVGFKYTPDGPAVLHDLHLTVRRGEKVAIVGPTGAGKSTIVKLVARFYDPTSGRVMLDGVDIREARISDLRRKLAVVLQDPYLFEGTILENVAFGHQATEQAVLDRAAERTQASAVIARRADGWDAKVGERGAGLSAGERQLIAFARALALDPELLVLDEATSAVDPETEARIQKGLEALIENRTAIIIAHRLSTIRRADRIVVLAAGHVVEEGSHDELMLRGGVYRKLYELQFAENGDTTVRSVTSPAA